MVLLSFSSRYFNPQQSSAVRTQQHTLPNAANLVARTPADSTNLGSNLYLRDKKPTTAPAAPPRAAGSAAAKTAAPAAKPAAVRASAKAESNLLAALLGGGDSDGAGAAVISMDLFDGVGLNEDFRHNTGSIVKAKSGGAGIFSSGGATHAVPQKADAKGGETETRKADVVTIDGRDGGQDHVAGLMDEKEESSIGKWCTSHLCWQRFR